MTPDEQTEMEKTDSRHLDAAIRILGEHFDSVLIFVTRAEADKLTVKAERTHGNAFANYGMAKLYCKNFEANDRECDCGCGEEDDEP